MKEKLYTVDGVAELLGMHHKTIRKFITEGKLRANKVGKQWRISGHDLSNFMENNNVAITQKDNLENDKIEFSAADEGITNKANKVNVSTVVDINDVNIDEHTRISNMLLAVMNTKDPKMVGSTINMKHYKDEKNLKVMLWGSIEFITIMLDSIKILIDNR